jgi:hypothetical protein
VLGRVSPDTWGLLAIVAAVLVAHGPYFVGHFNPNPLGAQSWLWTSDSPGLFPGLATLDPAAGTVSQALGHRAVLDWFHLQWPWWNPYEGTGVPLAGEMQAAALFPFTILTVFSNGQLWEHMLLELIGGASTFLLMRRLSVGVWASTAAGIAFALNGVFSWLANAAVNPIAFLPLLLLGLELARSASIGDARGGWWLIPVAGALMFYAGFPEVALIDAVMAAVWFAWRCWELRANTRAVRAFALKAMTGTVVALLLIAPLLVPIVDYLNHANTYGHQSAALTSERIPHLGLPQLLLPYVYGPILSFFDPGVTMGAIWTRVGGYLSTSIVLFALFGVLSRRHLGLRVLLVAWVLAGLSHTYGLPPLIGRVFDLVPGMSHVGFFRYGTSSIELAVIILAGLGLDDLIAKRVRPLRLIITTSVALELVLVAALAAAPLVRQLGANNAHSSFFIGSVVWGATIITVASVVALVRRPGARATLLVGVVALDVIALFVAAQVSGPRNVKIDLAPVAYLRQHLGTSRYFTFRPVAANYGSYFGIGELNTSDNPAPTLFNDYVTRRLDPSVFAADFWGTDPGAEQALISNIANYRAAAVAYVLAPAGQTLPRSDGFSLAAKTPSTWIYRLAGSQPYFTASGCAVSIQSRTDVRLVCPRATTLVRRETSMPGWSAQIDGQTTPVRTVDDIFQGVEVGAGTHRVTFGFTPPGETLGLIGFAGGFIWLVAGAVGLRFRARRTNP